MKNEKVLESIAEGSVLIAEFLGWHKCDCGNTPIHYKRGELNYQVTNVHDMKFNTSWDWLMPVFRKIKMIEDKIHFDERGNELIKVIEKYICLVQIEDTHLYLVEFIIWFNSIDSKTSH